MPTHALAMLLPNGFRPDAHERTVVLLDGHNRWHRADSGKYVQGKNGKEQAHADSGTRWQHIGDTRPKRVSLQLATYVDRDSDVMMMRLRRKCDDDVNAMMKRCCVVSTMMMRC